MIYLIQTDKLYNIIKNNLIFINVFIMIYSGVFFSVRDINYKDKSNYIEDFLNLLLNKNDSLRFSFKIIDGIKYIKPIISIYLVGIIILTGVELIRWIQNQNRKKQNYKKENKNELYKGLYNYLKSDNDKNPILIEGEWGAGKTYILNKFFEDYYDNFKMQKIYKISCFGIHSRENIIKEIKSTCEKEDNGILKYLVRCVSYIPLFGEIICNIYEKRYEINRIKEKSVFVFDNFERITPIIKKYEIDKNGIARGYIENEYEILEKYNNITGIINELIERYNMKIIIIASDKDMIPNYIVDNFINKLSCKIFSINNIKGKDIIQKTWDDIIESIYLPENLKNKFNRVFQYEKYNINCLFYNAKNKNIRILRRVFYNYIQFIKKVMENNIDCLEYGNNFFEGILYTCMITQFYNKDSNLFSKITFGENIGEYIEIKNIKKFDMVEMSTIEFDCRYIDANFYAFNGDSRLWENSLSTYDEIINLINIYHKNLDYKRINKFNFDKIQIRKGDKFHIKEIISLVYRYDEAFLNNFIEIFDKGIIVFDGETQEEKKEELDKYFNKYSNHKNVFKYNNEYRNIMKDYLELNFSNDMLNSLKNNRIINAILFDL